MGWVPGIFEAISKAASRSAVPSACVTIVRTSNPLRFSIQYVPQVTQLGFRSLRLLVQSCEPRRHLLQDRVHHLPDRSQGMILRHALLRRYVAEHRFLFRVFSAHGFSSAVRCEQEIDVPNHAKDAYKTDFVSFSTSC